MTFLYDILLSCYLPIPDCCYQAINLHLSQICVYIYTYTGNWRYQNEIKSIIISIQNIQFYKIIHNNIIYNEFPYDSEIEFYSQNFIYM